MTFNVALQVEEVVKKVSEDSDEEETLGNYDEESRFELDSEYQ